jgi:uncharacterized delta-60 repeat protein
MAGIRKLSAITMGIGALVLSGLPAAGAPGDLDTSYGADGKAVIDLLGVDDDESIAEAVIDAEGRLVVTGTINMAEGFVARLLSDGTIDETFGVDGIATSPAGVTSFVGIDIQADGKLVAVGGTGNDIAIVRYDADGALDTSFGGDGRADLDVSVDFPRDVAVQPSGRITVLGQTSTANGENLVANFTDAGDPDLGFSPTGWVTFESGVATEDPMALAFGPSDAALGSSIYVAGSRTAAGNSDAFLARLANNGMLDNTFGGGDGYVLIDLSPGIADSAADLVVDRDGKVVIVGNTASGTDRDVLAARFTTDGILDPAFSDDGVTTIDIGSGNNDGDEGLAVDLQADGRIVIGASSIDELGDMFVNYAAVRLLPDGNPDTSFSGDGNVVVPIGPVVDTPVDAVVDNLGGLLLVGTSNRENGDGPELALARLTGQTTRCGGELVTVDLAFGQRPTKGADVIRGTNAADTINARGGDDVVCGRGGADQIRGRGGADRLLGGKGADNLNGGRGNDILNGGRGNDTCKGGPGQNQLISC